jgi:hypothetical protein
VTDSSSFDVVWPRSPLGVQSQRLAHRLDTLRGRTIGFLSDYLFRGDELFPALARELTERYDAVIVSYDVFGNTHGPNEAQVVGEIASILASRGVDAVVSGVGC